MSRDIGSLLSLYHPTGGKLNDTPFLSSHSWLGRMVPSHAAMLRQSLGLCYKKEQRKNEHWGTTDSLYSRNVIEVFWANFNIVHINVAMLKFFKNVFISLERLSERGRDSKRSSIR